MHCNDFSLDRYIELHDVQTLAMLCCVFWTPEPGPKVERATSKSSVEYVPADVSVFCYAVKSVLSCSIVITIYVYIFIMTSVSCYQQFDVFVVCLTFVCLVGF